MKKQEIEVKVLRFNPRGQQEPNYEIFRVPFEEGLSVSNLLEYINREYRAGISYFCSCRVGICRGCLVRIDGRVKRACVEPVRGDITIEPLKRRKVIRDLLVELKGTEGGK